MNVARFWAKAHYIATTSEHRITKVIRWGWSTSSLEDAQKKAYNAAKKAAAAIISGQPFANNSYYPNRPLREEVVEEIKDNTGATIATVTRNSYGSLILNTRDLMFIDIDIPYQPPVSKLWDFLCRLFGHTIIREEDELFSRLTQHITTLREYTIRLYQTRAGYRCAILNTSLDPTHVASINLLNQFEADPLYVRLCQNQACYRARLTPKHWRMDFGKPPNRYPWEKRPDELDYRRWEKEYTERSKSFATCHLVKQFGSKRINPQLEALINFHDTLTKATSNLPLA